MSIFKNSGLGSVFWIRGEPAKMKLMKISRLLLATLAGDEPAKLKKTQISRPHLRKHHKIEPAKLIFFKNCRLKSFFHSDYRKLQ